METTATLTINLGEAEANDECSRSVLFQVKNGNLLPGQMVHFLLWGLDWNELDQYVVVDASQRPCQYVGRNTVNAGSSLMASDVAFDGSSLYGQMEWPCPSIVKAYTLTGITGITKDKALVPLHAKGTWVTNLKRRGYCCAEYENSSYAGIVGAMRVYSTPPYNKEFEGYVTEGVNPFFVLRNGLFVKAFNVEVSSEEINDDVVPTQWYSANFYFVDADTGMPLSGVNVTLGGTRTGVTGAAGTLQFTDLPPGDYSLHATKVGYYDSLQDDIDNDEVSIG